MAGMFVAIAASPPLFARSEKFSAQETDRLLDVFENICMKGGSRFRAGEITRITIDEVPIAVQNSWHYSDEKTFYRLAASIPTYLLVFNGIQTTGRDYASGCAIVSTGIDRNYAFDRVKARLLGQPFKPKVHPYRYIGGYELVSPTGGYVVTSRHLPAGKVDYTAVQVGIMNQKNGK